VKYLILTCGHTAAGKTTISKLIQEYFHERLYFISEAKLKRSLVSGEYTFKDSMNETLRDAGYNLALQKAIDNSKAFDMILIDASFHQRKRRKWVFDKFRQISPVFLWLFVECDDKKIISQRIKARFHSINKNHDNQANSMKVYNYIIRSFQKPTLNEFKLISDKSTLIKVNTCSKTISIEGYIDSLIKNILNVIKKNI
jgi:predicted kinase